MVCLFMFDCLQIPDCEREGVKREGGERKRRGKKQERERERWEVKGDVKSWFFLPSVPERLTERKCVVLPKIYFLCKMVLNVKHDLD